MRLSSVCATTDSDETNQTTQVAVKTCNALPVVPNNNIEVVVLSNMHTNVQE
jgi:hypothetical protein